MRSTILPASMMLVLALSAAACAGDDTATHTTTSSAPSGSEVETVTQPEMGGAGWEEVIPGGGCRCSDGSEFKFLVHPGSTEHVLFYLQSGGACFTAELCVPNETYRPTLHDIPPETDGIFDFTHADNPVAGYTVVYVPYCSGDVFLGDATTEYSADLTVQHAGFANALAALTYLATNYPNATDVVVAGESAGSVAVPVYGGLASDRFPNAAITAIADSSGAYPDLPELNAQMATSWNVATAIEALTGDAADAAKFSIPDLYVLAGQHHPDVTFARHDYSADHDQTTWFERIGLPGGDVASQIAANEQAIESTGIDVASYTTPGDSHIALSRDLVYTEEVDGVTLVDWIHGLIDRTAITDVPRQ